MRSFRKWSTVGSLVTVLSSANTAVLADIDKIKASAVVADFRLYFWAIICQKKSLIDIHFAWLFSLFAKIIAPL